MLDRNDLLPQRSLIAPVLLAQLRASMAIEPQERESLLRRFGGQGDWLEDLLVRPDVVALHLPDGLFLGLLDAQPLGRVAVFDVSAGGGGAGGSRPIAEILGLKRDFHYVRMREACLPLMRDLPPEVHYAAAGYSGFMGSGYALVAAHCLGLGRSEKGLLHAREIESLRAAPADCPARLVPFWGEAFALACRYFEIVSAGAQISPLDAT